LIVDSPDLPPELVGAALKCKGRENCYPVSDASGYSGVAAVPSGREIDIEPNGYLHLHN
jgi:hypothetical protein